MHGVGSRLLISWTQFTQRLSRRRTHIEPSSARLEQRIGPDVRARDVAGPALRPPTQKAVLDHFVSAHSTFNRTEAGLSEIRVRIEEEQNVRVDMSAAGSRHRYARYV